MKKEDLCYGNKDNPKIFINNPDLSHRLKRYTLKCPVCKRKVMASLKISADGDALVHVIPPHKPKLWWKIRSKL